VYTLETRVSIQSGHPNQVQFPILSLTYCVLVLIFFFFLSSTIGKIKKCSDTLTEESEGAQDLVLLLRSSFKPVFQIY